MAANRVAAVGHRWFSALAAAVVGLAAACCALGYAIASHRAEQRLLDDSLDQLVLRAESELDRWATDLAGAVERIGRELVREHPGVLQRLVRGEALSAAGARLVEGWRSDASLVQLWILDREGRVLVTSPASGAHEMRYAGWPADQPRWTRLDSERIALGVRHEVRVGGATLSIVGIRSSLASDLPRLAPSDGGAAVVLASGRVAQSFGALPQSNRSLSLPGGSGEEIARLVLGRSPESLRIERRRLRVAFAVLFVGVALVGLVASSWLARRAVRPVEQTLRAVDAIAAGEADYSFPTIDADRLAALPESFSRLHRALADQQRRRAAAEKVAAWQEVARRVAHEVKNPLAPIRLTIQNLVKARHRAPEMFDEILEQGSRAILEEVGRLERLVREFSEFARLPEPVLEDRDLDRIVDSVVALHGAPERVHRAPPATPARLAVRADRDLLAQAINNLIGNAMQAVGQGAGTVSVETGIEGSMACLRIGDDGPGFDESTLERVFEPYFTTRAQGTGLGMAIAYRIVADHGGFITAANRPEGGAEVTVKLPLRADPAPGT